MKKNITISIGISAYNEESNIKLLLDYLLKQNIDHAKITKIYVISDAGTDKTVEEINSIKDSRIVLIENAVRKGKTMNMNKIFHLADDDLLLILDADILPSGNRFIQEIVTEYQKNTRVGLIGVNITSLRSKTFFERIIEISHQFKSAMYLKANTDESIYLCHGRARAFTKEFYKKLTIPSDVPEDAYSYLQCKKLGYPFRSAVRANIFFRSPGNFSDHVKQSTRFFGGKDSLRKYFSSSEIKEAYRLKISVILKTFLQFMARYPMEIILYFFTVLFIKIFVNKKNTNQSLWVIARTSKILKLI